ncbi:MAG: histidine kinase, partial [Planctomycetaceae bacterium]|nr:histidine kinase [Planctomycetaceae bacterium]
MARPGRPPGKYTQYRRLSQLREMLEAHPKGLSLYEIAAFLNDPASLEELCRGFIRRVIRASGAQGGAVRLFDSKSQKLFLLIHDGLSDEFVRKEAAMCSGECVCGEVARDAVPLVAFIGKPPASMTL